jgi:hypothetical protein
MPKKTRPAPLGATYKQDVRLRWSRPKPDAAPNGAERVLFNRGYKDFAPMELGAASQPQPNSRGLFFAFLAIFCGYPKIFVTSVPLAEVASRAYQITRVNGAKSALW